MTATVSYFELPARDLERAATFYRSAFGWDVRPLEWDGPTYLRVRPASGADSGITGGLSEPGPYVPEQPLLVIHVAGERLEQVIERVVAAGGSVEIPVTTVGSFGTFARICDPEGHPLGLWQTGG